MTISTGATGAKWMGLLAVFTMFCGASGAHAAGRAFSDDFESGSVSKWSKDPAHAMCTAVKTAVDGVAPKGGSYNAECNWNGVVSWSAQDSYSGLQLSSWDYSREFLIRVWVRYASDVDHAMGAKVLRLYPGSDSFYMGAQMEQTGGPLFTFFESMGGKSGPLSYGTGTTVGNGKWHKIEIYIKDNTSGAADGTVRVWADGVKQVEAVNAVTVSSGQKWKLLELMSNWSSNPGWEHDAANHVYWDNIEVFTDKATGATGSMSDASITAGGDTKVPSPPVNVSVQ